MHNFLGSTHSGQDVTMESSYLAGRRVALFSRGEVQHVNTEDGLNPHP